MRVTAYVLPICFCCALVLGLGALAYGLEVTTEGESVGLGGLILQEPGASAVPPTSNVWVEATFVELDAAIIRHVEEVVGFRLGPPGGKAILNAEEKDKLLSVIEEMPGARTIASLSVLTISGQQAQSEDVEELTYPTEYDTETINIPEGGERPLSGEVFMVTPGNWEQRDVGTILNVTPTIIEDDRIALVLMPEVTILVKWINYGNEVYPIMQPVFRTWNKTTTVIIPDGASFVLKESPLKPLHHRPMPHPEAPMGPPRAVKPEGRTRFLRELRSGEPVESPPPIGPKAMKPAIAEKPRPGREEILRKLEIIIPEVKFEDASLKDVVDYLSRQCDVNIVIDAVVFAPGQPPEDGDIKLNLKSVPLKEVLKFIVKWKNLKYFVEDYAILVVPVDYAPPECLETEIFRLLSPIPPGGEPGTGETIEDFLRQCVPWPKGSNLVYDEKTGAVIVTNTPENLQLIRDMVVLYDPPVARPHEPPHQTTLLTIISAKVVESK